MKIDLMRPPPVDRDWLARFMRRFMDGEPAISWTLALEHALLAHPWTWLLEPSEAADLWTASVRNAGWSPPLRR